MVNLMGHHEVCTSGSHYLHTRVISATTTDPIVTRKVTKVVLLQHAGAYKPMQHTLN